MKILFLNPPAKNENKYIREGRCMQLASSWAAIWPPLTLAILAAIARKLGHEASILDANVEELKFADLPGLADAADILVLNTSFPSIDSDLEAARIIKKRRRGIIIISFGVFFTMLEEGSLPKDKSIDYAIIGEPEETFKELLVSLAAGTGKEKINGLIFLKEDGTVTKTAPRELIADLDSLPVPDRSLLKNEKYILPNNGEAFTLVNTSRGCPFPCTFCIVKAYYGTKIRRHSTAYVLDEISDCVKTFKLLNFLLWEEAFTLDKKVIKEFCNGLLERKLDIKWAITTRADSLDLESLRLMKRTGCFLVGMGIESSSQKVLDMARKQEKIEEIARGVRLCNEAGIPVMGHFIFGLPGETRETARETIRFMNKVGITYMQGYCAVPYPKTEFGELARKEGWIITDDWSRFDFGGESIVNMPAITAQEITGFRRKAFRRFYFRPGKILEEILKIRKFRLFTRALSFLRWIK